MFCSCGSLSKSERKDQVRRKRENDRINVLIEEDRLLNRVTNRVLLLGTAGSGKSTVLKQMRILQGDGFTEEEKRLQMAHIRNNIRGAMVTIAGTMRSLIPRVALEHPENQFRVDYIQNVASKSDFDYPPEFYEHTENLWKDRGVQSCFDERLKGTQLFDCAKYFLDKIIEIRQPNYTPSNQDILRCRAPTLRIFESRLQVNGVYFHLFEVGEKCDGRRKLLRYFNDVNAIIFVADCRGFSTVLEEEDDDACQNRLQESLEEFMSTWNNYWYYQLPVVLFLNKQDLLREKVKGGKCKLEDYFPDFAHYQTPADATPQPGDDDESIRARFFIRDQFLRISTASGEDRHWRHCYPIFTSALGTEGIRRVFDICYDLRTAFSRDRNSYHLDV